MSNGNNIYIIKRDGNKEELNIDKIHKVVEFACEGLAGVSSSQIEMNANIQFYDGMTSTEIQEILIKSANDLISLDNPNYQYAAARLLLYTTYKEIFGEYKTLPLRELIDLNIEHGVYDTEILEKYTDEELNKLDKLIKY